MFGTHKKSSQSHGVINSRGSASSTSTTIMGGPTNDSSTSPFFKLSAELRNAIYEHVFSDERTRGLAPHALARTSRQTRQESLFMWLIRFDTIEVPLLVPEHLTHFKQWISYFESQQLPVLPDFEFTYVDPVRLLPGVSPFELQCTVLRCNRVITLPAQEAVLPTAIYYRSPSLSTFSTLSDLECAYIFCLGCLRQFGGFYVPDPYVPDPSPKFKKAINKQRRWITRRLSFIGEQAVGHIGLNGAPKKYYHLQAVHDFFKLVALRKQGKDWNTADLKVIADFLYGRSHYYGGSLDRQALDRERKSVSQQ